MLYLPGGKKTLTQCAQGQGGGRGEVVDASLTFSSIFVS